MVYIICSILNVKNFHAVLSLYLFMGIVCRNVLFFFLSIFSNCFLERRYLKCFILDVAGVLNPPQYAPTWIAYIFKCLAKDNNWSL